MLRAGRKHETGEGVSQKTFRCFVMGIAIYQRVSAWMSLLGAMQPRSEG